MQDQLQLTSPAGSNGPRRTRRHANGSSAARPTRPTVRLGTDRRHPPAVSRLTEETRRTGREGVAMARRELHRALGVESVDGDGDGHSQPAA
jgi:hypothetical protein